MEATNQYFYIDEEGASQWADKERPLTRERVAGEKRKGLEGGQEARRWTMNKEKRESHFDPDSNRLYVVVDEDTQETAWLSDTEKED